MCGIAGFFNLDGRPAEGHDVQVFVDSLTHRGPDGSGVYTHGPIGLGHRRLSILDLSEAGRQPMADTDRRFHITFNGEIFNFLELRRELEQDGAHFATDSDTEVILAAYKRWGADCVLRFNGMWAFAIWDASREELFLSRDRFGVKPLRYLQEAGRFSFASELKSFRHLAGFAPRENVTEMRNLLARGGMSMEETPFEGVKRLPGGYNMLVTRESVRKWRWWRTIDHLPAVPATFNEQVEQFRELFFDAVRVRLRSDVPVASCLSGGLDSSSIVCALPELSRNAGEREARDCHHAFVASFPGTSRDERSYAEAVIEKTAAEGHIFAVEADDVVKHVEQYCYDIEMCGDRLSIPLWMTYRNLRQHNIVVSLDGHGADEMLAGYDRPYLNALHAEGNLLRAPRQTLSRARTVHGIYGSAARGRKSLYSILADNDPVLRANRALMHRGWTAFEHRVLGRKDAHSAGATTGVADWAQKVAPIRYMDDDTRDIAERLGPFKGFLYKEFHGTTLVNVLRTFDRCSMAHGVEIRMPFMDWRLVTYTFALPDDAIAGDGYTKRILREAMRGALPEVVRTRKSKMGFGSPMEHWFNGALGDWVMSEITSRPFVESALWNGPAIRDFALERHRSKSWTKDDAQQVWRFVQANRWRTVVGHA